MTGFLLCGMEKTSETSEPKERLASGSVEGLARTLHFTFVTEDPPSLMQHSHSGWRGPSSTRFCERHRRRGDLDGNASSQWMQTGDKRNGSVDILLGLGRFPFGNAPVTGLTSLQPTHVEGEQFEAHVVQA